MPWAVKKTQRLFKLALDRFRLIDEGEKVIVGVSGGPDSLCLLQLLNYHNKRFRKNWYLQAVHIDPGFEAWNAQRVKNACLRIGVDCIIKKIDVPAKLKATKTDSCFFCARERRKALFETASEFGCRKVALAHHLEDVNETFLMNLIFASSGSTFVPSQELFKGGIIVIRPLYYIDKTMITNYLKQARIRSVCNHCPYERTGSRLMIRRFLERLYKKDSRTRTNIFWGLSNLKPEYLPEAGRHKP
ncbi:tRNA lysidine(34) synthetase TilS [candidate division WOR-3 bacterium JGI_Cruoil_03_51_56]|uniref:tRNA lysidine(34) synthetase TilS n=1 Tax=candidate division WOR-3 bacterium JGI_Cruoil_03_51_56 TaxID=1973747 RepID=A0A235BV29_UNCW3|nr:MAG: tRNA lysidine(34) synthetase TilS [candidate division WOR-3 bacterium JGI_Cruoil_03_51_56]